MARRRDGVDEAEATKPRDSVCVGDAVRLIVLLCDADSVVVLDWEGVCDGVIGGVEDSDGVVEDEGESATPEMVTLRM